MIHNALRTYAKLLDAIRRAAGESAGTDFSGVERLSETLVPVLDIWRRPEHALLRGEKLFARRVNSAAVAARFSSVELVNPTGSQVLAVVQRIKCSSGNAIIAIDNGAALGVTATTNGIVVDGRNATLGFDSTCTLVTGDFAATVANPQDFVTFAGGAAGASTFGSDFPWILPPGRKLFMVCDTVNTAINMTVLWWERPLLPNEARA